MLQRQLSSFQQQFYDLCDHPAVTSVLKTAACPQPSPSFTNIRTALDSAVSYHSALQREVGKCEQERSDRQEQAVAVLDIERAGWQQQLDAASREARAAFLENEELKRGVEQLTCACESAEVRSAASDAAVKFFAEQHVKGQEEVAVLQRQLRALSSELQPAFARSMELKQRVTELQACLEVERSHTAAAELRCRQLDAMCSEQATQLASKMNSAKAAASARLSARVTSIMLNEVMRPEYIGGVAVRGSLTTEAQ